MRRRIEAVVLAIAGGMALQEKQRRWRGTKEEERCVVGRGGEETYGRRNIGGQRAVVGND